MPKKRYSAEEVFSAVLDDDGSDLEPEINADKIGLGLGLDDVGLEEMDIDDDLLSNSDDQSDEDADRPRPMSGPDDPPDQNNDEFYLQDTKSSNGTFVNNQRLSKGSEESLPKEINSGDIIQFGVDVMENKGARGVITHGCIVATLTLYLPDGREAIRSPNVIAVNPYSELTLANSTVKSQDLFQIAEYLKEALHREQMLEQKLVMLQRVVRNTQDASESSWQALIDEERLLSRLELLENQLYVYSKANTEDKIRKEVVALQEDKFNYESTAKDTLKRALEEKLEAVQKLANVEKLLSNSEDELSNAKENYDKLKEELNGVYDKHANVLKTLQELTEKNQETDNKHKEDIQKVNLEKVELEKRIRELIKEGNMLEVKIEELEAENDFTREQLAALQLRAVETSQTQEIKTDLVESKTNGTSSPTPVVPTVNGNPDMNNDTSEIDQILDDFDLHLDNEVKRMDDDDTDTPKDSPEDMDDDDLITIIDDRYRQEVLVNQKNTTLRPVDQATNKDQKYDDKNHIADTTQEEITKYKAEILASESRVKEKQDKIDQLTATLQRLKIESIESITECNALKETIKEMEKERIKLTEFPDQPPAVDVVEDNLLLAIQNHVGESQEAKNSRKELEISNNEVKMLRGKLQTSESQVKCLQEELSKLKDDLAKDSRGKTEARDMQSLSKQLSSAQKQVRDGDLQVAKLKEQLSKLESEKKICKNKVSELTDQLAKEQKASKTHHTQAGQMIDNLNSEVQLSKKKDAQIDEMKKQLTESQRLLKSSSSEVEDFKKQIRKLTSELEKEKQERSRVYADMPPTTPVSPTLDDPLKLKKSEKERKKGCKDDDDTTQDVDPDNSGDPSTLREECAGLRRRLQSVDAELRKTRKDNAILNQDVRRLQTSLKDLDQQKKDLSDKEVVVKSKVQHAKVEVTSAKTELSKAKGDLTDVQQELHVHREENKKLKAELLKLKTLSGNGATGPYMTYLPVVVILIAIATAVFQLFYAFSAPV
ncbi:sarcolemmal membrane-associated protein-like [Anneissia japonica]|uniref:sarcolemmal membrane-associated protein-like n=1 Tax=Anneissia japonica TaxID=1529436 RepID=UPI00142586B7|nr:sarcolemmal membrane-associated protein-like [Anneissia japonica]